MHHHYLSSNVNFKMFIEYFTEVENTLASYKQECASKIKEATQMIENLLQTTEGQNEIRSKFK